MAVQVDQHIRLDLADQAGDLLVALVVAGDDMIEGGEHAGTNVAGLVR